MPILCWHVQLSHTKRHLTQIHDSVSCPFSENDAASLFAPQLTQLLEDAQGIKLSAVGGCTGHQTVAVYY